MLMGAMKMKISSPVSNGFLNNLFVSASSFRGGIFYLPFYLDFGLLIPRGGMMPLSKANQSMQKDLLLSKQITPKVFSTIKHKK